MNDKHINQRRLASLYNHQLDHMGNVLFKEKDDCGGDGFNEGQDCFKDYLTVVSHFT